MKTVSEMSLGFVTEIPGIVLPEQSACISANRITLRSEHLIEGFAFRFAAQIPEGHVDSAQRRDRRPFSAIPARYCVHAPPEFFDL